ncbi:MAG: diguanylate cyclase [Rickettsiales bacterium]|nr:MAG: diguanylate cyclase [Rickettsiales bacterium]
MRIVCKLLLILILSTSTSFAKHIMFSGLSFDKQPISKNVSMKADSVFYDASTDIITAKGNIFVSMGGYSLYADQMNYDSKRDVIFAEGNVRVVDIDGKVIYGEHVVLKDKLKRGVIKDFIAKLEKNSVITANSAIRLSKNKYVMKGSVFTSCKMTCNRKPIWQLNAAHVGVDLDKHEMTYKHVFFEVYGIPIMYFPYFQHSTPNAPAKSGLLTPKIKHGDFMLPFYFRVKPNLDLTLSPRTSGKYTIFETELRHKVKYGGYEVLGSYGNVEFKKTTATNITKTTKTGRYHLFATGSFVNNDIHYGFDIKRASDKAYLTNYHKIYDSYLTSKIYANKVNERNYFSLEGGYFQSLKSETSNLSTPLVLPSVRTQNVYAIDEEESLLLNVRSDNIAHRGSKGSQLARSSLDLELMKNIISDGGHMFSFSLANRADLYWVSFVDNKAKKAKKEKEEILYRTIPEFRTKWRYPLARSFAAGFNVKIEPTAMVVFGRRYKSEFEKFAQIDSPKNELSENNIFNANRYSGVDFHDYGTRFSYGANLSLASESIYVDAFLGQLLQKNNIKNENNSEYVGSIAIDIEDDFELFYRFRKDKKLSPILDEVGASIALERFTSKAVYTKLQNISRYFAKDGFEFERNKASQVSFDMDYNLVNNLWVGFSSKLDVSSKSIKMLTRSIRVTYSFDCVSINAVITNNSLLDASRGVKKTNDISFQVGLLGINM